MVSISSDYTVTLGTDDYYFRIKVGGTVIYTGRAYRRPGEQSSKVTVNDICAGYLSSAPSSWQSTTQYIPCAIAETFAVEKSLNGTTWTSVGSVQFLNSWDGSTVIANPGQAVAKGQPIRFVPTGTGAVTVTEYYSDGEFYADALYVPALYGFVVKRAASSQTGKTLTKVQIETSDYVVDQNADYGISYIAANGQWRVFLPRWNASESQSIARESITTDKGVRNFRNEITTTFTFRTGWMTDAQSRDFADNFLNSVSLLVWDVAAQKEIPAVLTDDAHEVKKFQNGRALVMYEFSLRVAKTTERR